MFKKISIIGVGLIGGSIALASKKKKACKQIWGFFRNEERLKKALKLKVVDRGTLDLEETIKDSDMVILSLPVVKTIEYLERIKPFLKSEIIITDVASTKELVLKKAKGVLKGFNFVGSHPLTGSEKRGFENSKEVKWENSICFVCKDSVCHQTAYQKVKAFWKRLGAKIIELTSLEHDKLVGAISHLPHIISYSLINSILPSYLQRSGQSFRSLIRIAGASSLVWTDIFLTNKKNIVNSLEKFLKEIYNFKRALESQNISEIQKLIKKANKKRERYLNI